MSQNKDQRQQKKFRLGEFIVGLLVVALVALVLAWFFQAIIFGEGTSACPQNLC